MTKQKVLEISEKLFFEKGYRAVALKEICDQLKIKPASLYYHFPKGKEQIYVEVIRARMATFRSNIDSIGLRAKDLRIALIEFGNWYIAQPKMNMVIIAELDMTELSPKSKKLVMEMVGNSVFEPLGQILWKFKSSLRPQLNPELIVASLTTLLFTIHTAVKMGGKSPSELVIYNVDLIMNGICNLDSIKSGSKNKDAI